MSIAEDHPALTDGSENQREYKSNGPSMTLVWVQSSKFEAQSSPAESSENDQLENWNFLRTAEDFKSWLVVDFPDAQILTISDPSASGNSQTGRYGRSDMNLLCEAWLHELKLALRNHSGCSVFLIGVGLGCFVAQGICLDAHRDSSLASWRESDEAEKVLHLISGIVFLLPLCLEETLRSDPQLARRRWSDFKRLCRVRNWKTCVFLDSEAVGRCPAEQTKNITEDCWTKDDLDYFYEVHEVDSRSRGSSDPMYKSLRDFLDIEFRRARAPLQEGMVGRDRLIQQLTTQLQGGSKSIQKLGLIGTFGVGKTTLARAIFHRLKEDFAYTCFVDVEKKYGGRPRSTVWEMICDHMERWGREVHPKGWKTLEGKKILFVFDDVNSQILEQFPKEFRDPEFFAPGSCFIGTSRIHSTFYSYDFSTHEVQPLEEKDAMTLLSSLAFPEKKIPVNLEPKVKEVVKYCGGLPLLLQLLGEHMGESNFARAKLEGVWDGVLRKLQDAEVQTEEDICVSTPIDQEDITERMLASLMNCFDSLAATEKHMFLDVATCFHGEVLEETLSAWRGMYPGSADSGWTNLLNLSLVSVIYSDATKTPQNPSPRPQKFFPAFAKHEEVISLHPHLQLLGRRLSQRNSEYMHQRISDRKTAYKLLENNQKIMETVRILKLDHDSWYSDLNFDLRWISRMPHLKTLWLRDVPLSGLESEIESQLSSIMIRWSGHSISGQEIFSSQERRLPRCFAALRTLNHLSLISGSEITVSEERLLTWEGRRSVYTASGSATMDLSAPTCKEKAADFKNLRTLQHMVLDKCSIMSLAENFGQLEDLRFLLISSCSGIRYLPPSFGHLSAMETLILKHLDSLQELPGSFGDLKRLKYLELGYCSNLKGLPDSFGGLSRLQSLKIRDLNSLEELPPSVGALRSLTFIELSLCSRLKHLPTSVGDISKLDSLELSDLGGLQVLPARISKLSRLERLTLQRCSTLRRLPESFRGLGNLRSLVVHKLDQVSYIPASLGDLDKLQYLEISECHNLEVLPDSLRRLSRLQVLNLCDLPSLKYVPSSLSLPNLENVTIKNCPIFRELISSDWVSSLGTLQKLDHFSVELGREELGVQPLNSSLDQSSSWLLERSDFREEVRGGSLTTNSRQMVSYPERSVFQLLCCITD